MGVAPSTSLSCRKVGDLRSDLTRMIVSLLAALKALGRNVNDGEVQQLLKAADEDGGGEIDFDEFCDLIGISLPNDKRKVCMLSDPPRSLAPQHPAAKEEKKKAEMQHKHKEVAAEAQISSMTDGLSEKQKKRLQEVRDLSCSPHSSQTL